MGGMVWVVGLEKDRVVGDEEDLMITQKSDKEIVARRNGCRKERVVMVER